MVKSIPILKIFTNHVKILRQTYKFKLKGKIIGKRSRKKINRL